MKPREKYAIRTDENNSTKLQAATLSYHVTYLPDANSQTVTK